MDLIYIVLIASGTFILLVLAGLAVVNFSSDELLDRFEQASRHETSTCPFDFAFLISKKFFNNKIKIDFTNKKLGDCFSSDGTLVLCSLYAPLNQLAGLAICAHELGHAFQFFYQKEKMKKYIKKIKLTKFLSKLIAPILISSLILLILNQIIVSIVVATLSVVIFILAICVKMSTIKIEKEASQKAIQLLKENTDMSEHDIMVAEKFLNSAKLTYIADLLKTMLKWTGFTRK